jgi:hypothetical protein
MKKYKYIKGIATNFTKNEKKAFCLKLSSLKLFLSGI